MKRGLIWLVCACLMVQPMAGLGEASAVQAEAVAMDAAMAKAYALCELPELGLAELGDKPRIVQGDSGWFFEVFPRLTSMPVDVWLNPDGSFDGFTNCAVGSVAEVGTLGSIVAYSAEAEAWCKYVSAFIADHASVLANIAGQASPVANYECLEFGEHLLYDSQEFVTVNLDFVDPVTNVMAPTWQAVIRIAPETQLVALNRMDRPADDTGTELAAGGDRVYAEKAAVPRSATDTAMDQQTAIAKARAVLVEQLALTQAEVDGLEVAEAYRMDYAFANGSFRSAWLICFSLGDPRSPFDYSVTLDEYTGEVFRLCEPSSIGNG